MTERYHQQSASPEFEQALAHQSELGRRAASATATPRHRSDGDRARLLLGIRAELIARRTRRSRQLATIIILPLACAGLWSLSRFARSPVQPASLASFEQGLESEPAAQPQKTDPAAPPATATVPTLPSVPAAEWHEFALAGLGTLRVRANTDYALPQLKLQPALPGASASPPPSLELDLRSGTVCAAVSHRDAATQGPFIVRAPGIAVWDVGTQFCVEARDTLSTVSVTEGTVRVQRPAGRELSLHAGEFLRSDDPRLAPRLPRSPAPAPAGQSQGAPAPTLQPAVANSAAAPQTAAASASLTLGADVRSCDSQPSLERKRSCFEQRALGDGIAAENALYSLALLDSQLHDPSAAIQELRRYQRRFAVGFLRCEVAYTLLQQRATTHDWSSAARESSTYLDHCPRGDRTDEVQILRGDALVELGQYPEASAAYRLSLQGHLSPDLATAARKGLERIARLAPDLPEE